MKILSLIWVFLAINASMALFFYGSYSAQVCPDGLAACPYNDTTLYSWNDGMNNYSNLNYANSTSDAVYLNDTGDIYSSNDLMDFFLTGFRGMNSRWIMYLSAFALLIGALGFIPFVNRSDISALSGVFILFLGAGIPTVINIWNFVNSESGAFVCEVAGQGCFISQIMAALTAGALGFMWIAACLEFWLGRSVS